MEFRPDCRFFRGDKPCSFLARCTCEHFAAWGPRILIIKLGALGDVLRTTPLVSALRKLHPDAHITWVTDAVCLEILKSNDAINRSMPLDAWTLATLAAEEFDLLLSLDKDAAAASLGSSVKAKNKRGYGWSPKGCVVPLDEKAHDSYYLGIDNELKFKANQKTYQQLMFELCDIPFESEEYQWNVSEDDLQNARFWAKGTGLDRRRGTIGLNTGWGEMFAGKGWKEEHWNRLINALQDLDCNIVLLGGPREEELNARLFRSHRGKGSLHQSGNHNSLGEFGGLIELCDLVVSGDTFGMHAAIARKKKVVALFGSTCHQEIDLYGRGVKLYPTDLPCSPCYKKVCDFTPIEDCLARISVEQVLGGIQGLLPLAAVKRQQFAMAGAVAGNGPERAEKEDRPDRSERQERNADAAQDEQKPRQQGQGREHRRWGRGRHRSHGRRPQQGPRDS